MSMEFWVGFAACWVIGGMANVAAAVALSREYGEYSNVFFLSFVFLLGPVVGVWELFE